MVQNFESVGRYSFPKYVFMYFFGLNTHVVQGESDEKQEKNIHEKGFKHSFHQLLYCTDLFSTTVISFPPAHIFFLNVGNDTIFY